MAARAWNVARRLFGERRLFFCDFRRMRIARAGSPPAFDSLVTPTRFERVTLRLGISFFA